MQQNQSLQGVYLVSLGCPKNLVDTEILAGELLSSGRGITFDPDEADVYLINTCAFIPAARQEAFDAIKVAKKWKRRDLESRKIVIAGCLTEYGKHTDLRAEYPEVDLWMGVNEIPHLVELLAANFPVSIPVDELPIYLYDENTPRLQLTVPHMAYLKIADGCNNCCSYCAIPGLRGVLRSRTILSIRCEAQNLLDGGVKELVLIAQDVTVYGLDRPQDQENITKLLSELDLLEGDFVIRLLYTHPAHYTDEFIDFLAKSRHVLPYLDIPIQHASERILEAMNRHTTKRATEELLTKLRTKIPGLVLRTTFITGFPGESIAEFEELCEFVKRWKFERCGVFAYAPEAKTPAAAFSPQVPKKLAEERAQKLMQIQHKIMVDYQKSHIGKSIRVLVDSVSGSRAYARGVMDAPEIDNFVVIKRANGLQEGDFCDILTKEVVDDNLVGELILKD